MNNLSLGDIFIFSDVLNRLCCSLVVFAFVHNIYCKSVFKLAVL